MKFSASFLLLLCALGLVGYSNGLYFPLDGIYQDTDYLTRDGPAQGTDETPITVPDGTVQSTSDVRSTDEVGETEATTSPSPNFNGTSPSANYGNESEPIDTTVKPPEDETHAHHPIHSHMYKVIYRILACAICSFLLLVFAKVAVYLRLRRIQRLRRPPQQPVVITRRFQDLVDREVQYPYAHGP